jgi:alpha-glucoside transport system permease protein
MADITATLPAQNAGSFWQRIDYSKLASHLILLLLVILWTLPTAGLLVSSIRDKDQLTVSGWWSALTTTERTGGGRTLAADAQQNIDGKWVIEGNLFSEDEMGRTISRYGLTNKSFDETKVGDPVFPKDGGELTV